MLALSDLIAFLLELTFLDGRAKLPGRPIVSLIEY